MTTVAAEASTLPAELASLVPPPPDEPNAVRSRSATLVATAPNIAASSEAVKALSRPTIRRTDHA